jgi:tight adherence protein C
MDILADINDWLTGSLGAFGPLIAVGVLGVIMVLVTLPFLLNQPEDPMKKLKRDATGQDAAGRAGQKGERLRQANRNEQLEKFATFLEPQDAEELSAMQLKLRQAGYQSKDAVRVFHFAQFALGLLGLAAGLGYVWISGIGANIDTQTLAMYVVGPGGAGYMLPRYWVTRRAEERKKEIGQGFPDALDMMLVCVEAGQSLDQSIVRVAREIRRSYPALAEEFEVVAYEMKAGKEKDKVLRDIGRPAAVCRTSRPLSQ